MKCIDFLPELIDTNGEWEDIVNRLYLVFVNDLKNRMIYFESRRVIFDNRKTDSDKENAFWHLIDKEKDKEKDNRLFDPRRAERLGWIRPIIENSHCPDILKFDYVEDNGKVRTYLWLKEYNFVVILEKQTRNRSNLAALITAFYVSGKKNINLQYKYENKV